MRNIAFINNSGANGWGGVEKWTFKMATALNRRKYKVHIIARDISKIYLNSKKRGFNTKNIKRIGSATFLNPFRIRELYNYFKKNNIDTVFFCSSPTFKFGTVAASLAGVNNIIYRRGSATPIKNKFYNRYFMQKLSYFIANSKATKEKALKFIEDFPENKVKLIYNGVDLDNYQNISFNESIYEEFNISESNKVMINVGRLDTQKGQLYLIKAAELLKKRNDKFHILLVGKGKLEEELKMLVNKLGLENNITFTGFRKDIPELLTQADFMVHTALWEGCPWSVLESLAAGLPVLATDSSSLPEIIVEEKNGYLAKDKDIEDISEKMLMMCKSADLDSLSKGARETAEKHFNFDRVIDETESCFKDNAMEGLT